MSPNEFKKIREKLGLTQAQLAEILGLAGRATVTHYETGFRKPSALTAALMEIFFELPERESVRLRTLLRKHVLSQKKSVRGTRP